MTVHPRDLRRLIVRVVAVTLTLRAVHLFSVDLGPAEVAAAWALPADGHTAPLLHRLLNGWRALSGGFAGIVRLPALVADTALPLVAVAYARANGWGTISGLLAGLMVAVAPLGLDEGWRADASPWLALLTFAALWQLRAGLRQGVVRPVAVSGGLYGLAVALSPLSALVLPAGLWASARSVTGALPRRVALAGWTLATAAGLGAHAALTGGVAPGLDLASGWLSFALSNGGLPELPAPLDGAWQALAAVSAGGPLGGLATLLDSAPAPLWRTVVGLALWPVAALGLWRGLVREDPGPESAAVSDTGGAGAADGWRTLGVARNTAPRRLGERDWAPLLLPVIGAAAWCAWAGSRGDAAGVTDALAVARPFAAMLCGLGLTAFAFTPRGDEDLAPAKRAVPVLVFLALLLFGLGAHHTFEGTRLPSRMAPGKVARFAAGTGEVNRGGQVLALGLGGLQVAWRLGPWPDLRGITRAASASLQADAALAEVLAAKPRRLVVVGDRWALEEGAAVIAPGATGKRLHRRLDKAGYSIVPDGHRYLDRLSVRVYGQGDSEPRDPATINPQLYPGQAP